MDDTGAVQRVAYYSKKLHPRKQRYSTIEKAMCALKCALLVQVAFYKAMSKNFRDFCCDPFKTHQLCVHLLSSNCIAAIIPGYPFLSTSNI